MLTSCSCSSTYYKQNLFFCSILLFPKVHPVKCCKKLVTENWRYKPKLIPRLWIPQLCSSYTAQRLWKTIVIQPPPKHLFSVPWLENALESNYKKLSSWCCVIYRESYLFWRYWPRDSWLAQLSVPGNKLYVAPLWPNPHLKGRPFQEIWETSIAYCYFHRLVQLSRAQ